MNASARLMDAGIDYVRVTSAEDSAKLRMVAFYQAIVSRDEKLGYDEQRGGAFGFVGHKTRHALYGYKREWAMVQASGYEAKGALKMAISGTQCSRLDLQLTYYVGEGEVEGVIRNAYNQACALGDPQRRHMNVTMIESRHKSQTVYIGSRASDIFFRIYDKFAESKKEEYRGCVRFEVEVKGRASKALWARLIVGEEDMFGMLTMLVGLLKERGIEVPNPEIEAHDVVHFRKPKTLTENRISWLARQVAPTVTKLVQSHGWTFPFSVLFAESCTEQDRHAIIKTLQIVWGS